jgi:hypothetical protein
VAFHLDPETQIGVFYVPAEGAKMEPGVMGSLVDSVPPDRQIRYTEDPRTQEPTADSSTQPKPAK